MLSSGFGVESGKAQFSALSAKADYLPILERIPPPALRERRHRGLARPLVAVRRRAVLMVAEGERNFLASTMGLASKLATAGLVGTGLSPQGPMSGPTAMTGARWHVFTCSIRASDDPPNTKCLRR